MPVVSERSNKILRNYRKCIGVILIHSSKIKFFDPYVFIFEEASIEFNTRVCRQGPLLGSGWMS